VQSFRLRACLNHQLKRLVPNYVRVSMNYHHFRASAAEAVLCSGQVCFKAVSLAIPASIVSLCQPLCTRLSSKLVKYLFWPLSVCVCVSRLGTDLCLLFCLVLLMCINQAKAKCWILFGEGGVSCEKDTTLGICQNAIQPKWARVNNDNGLQLLATNRA